MSSSKESGAGGTEWVPVLRLIFPVSTCGLCTILSWSSDTFITVWILLLVSRYFYWSLYSFTGVWILVLVFWILWSMGSCKCLSILVLVFKYIFCSLNTFVGPWILLSDTCIDRLILSLVSRYFHGL